MLTTWEAIYERAKEGEVHYIDLLRKGVMRGYDNARPYLKRLEEGKRK